MRSAAGLFGVACAWMMVVMQDLATGSALKKHAAGAPCHLKGLTALTKAQVEKSLTSFDESNGKNLGTWPPGFPELQVHKNSPLIGPAVQCSLHFMAEGLEEILKDQRDNLNPKDIPLHKELQDTIHSVKTLETCVRNILGGKCPYNPPPPKMPKHVFERKQWSHTLLKSAGGYLDWLHNKIVILVSKVREAEKKKHPTAKASLQNSLRGRVYLL